VTVERFPLRRRERSSGLPGRRVALPLLAALAACATPDPNPPQVSLYEACPGWRALQRLMRYPPAAVWSRTEGIVVVAFRIAPTGDVGDIEVVRTAGPLLDGVVLDAVKQLQCNPRDGPIRMAITMPFMLR